MTRVGLVARCTRSGLGYLSKDIWDNYKFERALVITDCDKRYKDNLSWFTAGMGSCVRYADLSLYPCQNFLTGIDTLFSYETFYSAKLLEMAKRMGVKTVLMGMPELTRRKYHDGWIGDPDLYVWPTPWLVEEGERVLPVPVPIAPIATSVEHDQLRVLHVAGAPAIGDRNGTEIFISALRNVKQEVYVRIAVHSGYMPEIAWIPPNVTLEILRDPVNRWSMYYDMDVLVLPRRYGGLSLPVLEAAGCGMAIVLPGCPPNEIYPAQLLDCQPGGFQKVPIGRIRTHFTPPANVASAIDTLAENRDLLKTAKEDSVTWGIDRTWGALRPQYDDALQ